MLYCIQIGSEMFNVDELSEVYRMYAYCEKMYGFKGEKWEEIKSEFYHDVMGEMLEEIGVVYEEFIE